MSDTLDLLEKVIQKRFESHRIADADPRPSSQIIQKPQMIKPVRDNTLAYPQRHRGEWHKPEYDFERIQIAQDVDSYISRTISQKTDRFVLAGYEFVSENEDALFYIKQRIAHMSIATNRPFLFFLDQVFQDLVRYKNAIIVKKRDNERSLGQRRKHHTLDTMIDPVAGYFIPPFERLIFRSNANGTLKYLREQMPDGKYKDYPASDVIHIAVHKKPGFTVATPDLQSALDDILMLRRIEENVIELIETNLFPRFHFKVGTDDHPALYTVEGEHEVDYVRRMISYMPPGAVYVSDHRQKIEVVGSENNALRIDYYLEYFRKRVFAAIGTTDIDMGLGSSANRSTASSLSKQTLLSVEALQKILAEAVDFYIINELLMEGGFNPLDPNDRVSIRFGVVDKEERIALENQVIQKFINNVINHTEARRELGYPPADDAWMEKSYFKLFAEPLALAKLGVAPMSAAASALAELPQSNLTPEGVQKQAAYQERQNRITKQQSGGAGRGGSISHKSNGSSSNIARPQNQYGTRSAPKLTRDISFNLGDQVVTKRLELDYEVDDTILDNWTNDVVNLYHQLSSLEVRFESVLRNQLPRLHKMHEDTDEN